MENSETAVCTVCGKTYKTCLSCRRLDAVKPWRSIADTVDCYKIFLAVSQYNNKHITREAARKQLSEIKFVKKELKKSIQDEIDKITASEESAKRSMPKSKTEKCEQ